MALDKYTTLGNIHLKGNIKIIIIFSISFINNSSFERGEWVSTKNAKEEAAFAKKAAANFLRKDERVTLRLSSSDLMRLKQKAAYKGLPYQTFISSILHEYAAGHFKDVDTGDQA